MAQLRQPFVDMIFAIRTEAFVLAIEAISRSLQRTKHVELLVGSMRQLGDLPIVTLDLFLQRA